MILYHGTNANLTDYIKPARNITVAGEEGNFIFATSRKIDSFVYALWTKDMVSFLGFPDWKLVAIENHQNFMNVAQGTVFTIEPPHNFTQVMRNGQACDEYVSNQQLSVGRIKKETILARNGLNNLMQHGYQIIFLTDITRQDFSQTTSNLKKDSKGCMDYISNLIDRQQAIPAAQLYPVTSKSASKITWRDFVAGRGIKPQF